jgi:hypothetical protein
MRLSTLGWFLTPFLLFGCGSHETERFSAFVTGRVTLDGQPIAQGTIQFRPGSSAGGSIVTLAIKNGHFEGRAIPGLRRVAFSAPVVTGQRPQQDAPLAAPQEDTTESIPERYRPQGREQRTQLRAEPLTQTLRELQFGKLPEKTGPIVGSSLQC